jgi:hypothetical protein
MRDSIEEQPMAERGNVEDMSELELLERLFEMTCPSCDQDAVRQAAVEMAERIV